MISDRNQTAIKSWWPRTAAYEQMKSGENYGRWTEKTENDYHQRLAEIENGGLPLTMDQWRDRLRGQKVTRHLKAAAEKFSSEFLNSRVEGG